MNPKFNIGQKVWHCTPESDTGIVIDCVYSLYNNKWTYEVTFSTESPTLLYNENELSDRKIFS